MNKLTYKEAYDKIIQAYFNDEIRPMNCKFCFCGTLSPDERWALKRTGSEVVYPYTYDEYNRMENALFGITPLSSTNRLRTFAERGPWSAEVYENALFEGMCEALDELEEIHRERGEDVDSLPALTKRQLQTA